MPAASIDAAGTNGQDGDDTHWTDLVTPDEMPDQDGGDPWPNWMEDVE